MAPTAQTRERPLRRRRVLAWLLYGLLLVAGVFAAWQIHVFVRSRGEDRSGQSARYRLPARVAEPAWPASGLPELATAPAASVGLVPFSGEPGGFAPPAGASRQAGFQRRAEGTFQQQVSYGYPGRLHDAAAHYEHLLRAAGFTLLRSMPGQAGCRKLIFTHDRMDVIVALRNIRRQDKIEVRIVVTVNRPVQVANSTDD